MSLCMCCTYVLNRSKLGTLESQGLDLAMVNMVTYELALPDLHMIDVCPEQLST